MIIDQISKWFCRICITLLVLMLVSITVFALVNVVGRYLLHHTIFWVEEVTAIVMGWMVAIGVPLLWVEENHIVMNALDFILSKKAKYWWDLVVNVIAVFVGVMFLKGGLRALKFNTGYTVSLLKYDESVRYYFVPVMGGLLIFAALLTIAKKIKNGVEGGKKDVA